MTHYRVHARKLGVKPLDDAHAVASGEYDADMSAAGLDGPAQKRAYESAMGVTKMAEAGQLRVTNNDAMNVLKTGSTGSLIGDVALMAGNVEPAVGRGKKERKGARA